MATSLAMRTHSEIAKAEQGAKGQLGRLQESTPVLTEVQRRRIWMGYSRSGIDSHNPEVVNRSKLGRDWLISIGQEPDWSIDLDHEGKPRRSRAASCES